MVANHGSVITARVCAPLILRAFIALLLIAPLGGCLSGDTRAPERNGSPALVAARGSTPARRIGSVGGSSAAAARAALVEAERVAAAVPGLAEELAAGERGFAQREAAVRSPGVEQSHLHARLPNDASGDVVLAQGGAEAYTMRWTLDGAEAATLELDAGREIYRDVFAGTDEIWTGDDRTAEVFVVLRGESAPTSYRWSVKLSEGLAGGEPEPAGGIAFRDKSGQKRLRVGAAYALDATGVRREAQLGWGEGALTLSVDPEGLVFPVLVDPSVEVEWQLAMAAGNPPARYGHAPAYDIARGETVLFGGNGVDPGGTWTYSSFGSDCTANAQCGTGYCVDGVCCNTACGGGDPNDCLVCSAALGASTDGICSPRTDGTTCNDRNASPAGDICTSGVCGVPRSVTLASLAPSQSAKDSGSCANPSSVDGAACDDGSVCTLTDTCQSGLCTGSDPLPCSSPGPCQEAPTCNATIGCVFAPKPAGTLCSVATCRNGQAKPVGLCDGASTACPLTAPVECGSYTCKNDACSTTCGSSAGCASNAYCAQGTCLAKQPQGVTCSSTANCLAGSCVDGVCCDTTCTGQCEACDVSGHEGTCLPTTGAPHGGRTACSTDSSSCGGVCDGTVRDSCTYPTTSCRDASCDATSNVANLAANCNGQGTCPGLQTVFCTPSLCGATACNGDCTLDTDCADGTFCAAGVCTSKLATGTTCGADSQCLNGVCQDGVCCETACDGQCQACNEPNQAGTCVTVAGASRAGRAACAGTGDCQGSCDGSDPTSCTLPDTSTTCATGTCTSGTATAASTCDGAGTCQAGMETNCGAYTCGTNACKTSCTVVEDCATGHACVGGACAVEQDAGAEAGEDAANDAGDEASAEAGGDAAADATAEASVDAGAENDTLEAGDVPAAATPASDSGCGCRLAGTTPFSERVPALALVALAGAVIVRRRNRSL